MSDRKEMFDAGSAVTLHERNTGHLQTGSVVRAMVGEEKNARLCEGTVIGWWGEGDERRPRVRFTLGAGVTVTRTMDPSSLRLVRTIAFDPTRIAKHSEAQFSPDMSDAAYRVAIDNDDMMREHCS